MNAAATVLRPLTPAETRAVELHALDVPTAAITAQTRLTPDQIAIALARQAEWDALRNGATKRSPRKAANAALAEKPSTTPDEVPDVLPAPEPQPAIETATEPVAWDAVLPDTPGEGLVPVEEEPLYIEELAPEPAPAVGVDNLLARAEASPQPRVRQLAAEVREHLAEIERLLGNDEKFRVLSAAREVLRQQLAATERELAELLDAAFTVGAPVPEPEPDVPVDEPAAENEPATPPGAETLAHSRKVRAWARENGWNVGDRGIIPGAARLAYDAAHPDESGPR